MNSCSCSISTTFFLSMSPILQPHGTTHYFPHKMMLPCFCAFIFPLILYHPSLRISFLKYSLTTELLFHRTEKFYTIFKTSFLCELVPVVLSRGSHSCCMWCLEGPLASKCLPRNSHSLTRYTHKSVWFLSLSPSRPLSSGNYQVRPIHIQIIILHPPISLSLPSPLARIPVTVCWEKKKSNMYMVQKANVL